MAQDQARVQVRDLAPPDPLQPTNVVPDTYIKPAAVPRDNNMEVLSQALLSFAGNVSKFVAPQGPSKEDKANLEAQAHALRAAANNGELAPYIQKNPDAGANPITSPILFDRVGSDAGQQAALQVSERIRSGEIPLLDDNGNRTDLTSVFNQSVQERLQELAQQVNQPGVHPFGREKALSSFRQAVEAARNEALKQQSDAAANFSKDLLENRIATGLGVLSEWAATGKPDQEIQKQLQSTYADIRKLGLGNRQIDGILVGRLQKLAQSSPDGARTAVKILTMPRIDEKGGALPSLAGDDNKSGFSYRNELTDIIRQAKPMLAREQDSKAEQAMVDEAKRRLETGDGSFHSLQDQPYTNPYADQPNKILSADKARGAAVAVKMDEVNKTILERKLDPQTAANERQWQREQLYVNNSIPDPEKLAAYRKLDQVLLSQDVLSDPNKVAEGQAILEDLRTSRAKYPGYTEGLTKGLDRADKAALMYEVYSSRRTAAGYLDPQEAFRRTANFVNSPHEPLGREAQKKISDETNAVDLSYWPMATGVGNVMEVRSKIQRLASTIALDRSIDPKDAVKEAAQMVQDSGVSLNGRGFFADPEIRPDTVKYYQKRLDEIYSQHKADLKVLGINSSSDLSVVRSGTGLYLTDRSGEILTVRGPKDSSVRLRVTQGDIQRIRKQEGEAERKALIEQQRLNQIDSQLSGSPRLNPHPDRPALKAEKNAILSNQQAPQKAADVAVEAPFISVEQQKVDLNRTDREAPIAPPKQLSKPIIKPRLGSSFGRGGR